ncbi:hypothetical protein EV421DRAFT_2029404 [Armillaria borealis]|uniref:Uncharacterized protein n=1 Tax=Armillaria borealis TaxID=47425 RepID=A0AA39N128_9AGAR|nr:hypothetical protein EV421DRAFT_2029404 [Armillaria borealis]
MVSIVHAIADAAWHISMENSFYSAYLSGTSGFYGKGTSLSRLSEKITPPRRMALNVSRSALTRMMRSRSSFRKQSTSASRFVSTAQEGAAAIAIKLPLLSRVAEECGFFLNGLIVISTQLVWSTDMSWAGHAILLLTSTFKLSTSPALHPNPLKALTLFQANIHTDPFPAIPSYSISPPPSNLLQPPQSLGIAAEVDEEGRVE